MSRLTLRWSGRVIDKVPSSHVGARAAQLNYKGFPDKSSDVFSLICFASRSDARLSLLGVVLPTRVAR